MAAFVREPERAYGCKMMEALGIEPGGGVVPRLSLLYSAIFRRCQSCPTKKLCREWVDHAYPATLPPGFCANADALFELQYRQLADGS